MIIRLLEDDRCVIIKTHLTDSQFLAANPKGYILGSAKNEEEVKHISELPLLYKNKTIFIDKDRNDELNKVEIKKFDKEIYYNTPLFVEFKGNVFKITERFKVIIISIVLCNVLPKNFYVLDTDDKKHNFKMADMKKLLQSINNECHECFNTYYTNKEI